MNIGTLVAIVVVLVVAGLAWLFLKGRKRDADLPAVVPPPPIDVAVEPVPEAVAATVDTVPPAPPARVIEASPPPVAARPPPPAPRPAPVVAVKAPPPPESVTIILAKPRPPVPLVERVLVLETVDEAEWNAARPLALSAVQGAAVASAMTAATQPRPGESAVHAVRFDAGSAIRIARGDIETLRAVAAA